MGKIRLVSAFLQVAWPVLLLFGAGCSSPGAAKSDALALDAAAPDTENRAPKARVADLSLHVPAGTTVTLDGTASTDEAEAALSYRWEVVGPRDFELPDPTSPTPQFTPTARGSYAVRLIVNDGNSDSLSGPRDTTVVNAYAMKPLGDVVEVAAGWSHTVALKANDIVDAWGSNLSGATGRGANIAGGVAKIAAGTDRTVALTSGGAMLAWGRVGYALANAACSGYPCARTPVQFPALPNVTAITALPSALTADGTLWEWHGLGLSGKWEPRATGIKAIAESLAVRTDGTLLDTLGIPEVEALTDIAAVSTTTRSRCALANDGTVWTLEPAVSHVEGLTDVLVVAAGRTATCLALRNDGTVWEALGSGATPVPRLAGVVAIAANDLHAVVVKDDGTVWAWGTNEAGQLGDGNFGAGAASSTPVQVVF